MDAVAGLPELVAFVALVGLAVLLINAGTVHEAVEGLFIGSFVYRHSTFATLDVAGGLLESVLVPCGWMFCLKLQDLGEGLGPGRLLAYGLLLTPGWPQARAGCTVPGGAAQADLFPLSFVF